MLIDCIFILTIFINIDIGKQIILFMTFLKLYNSGGCKVFIFTKLFPRVVLECAQVCAVESVSRALLRFLFCVLEGENVILS